MSIQKDSSAVVEIYDNLAVNCFCIRDPNNSLYGWIPYSVAIHYDIRNTTPTGPLY